MLQGSLLPWLLDDAGFCGGGLCVLGIVGRHRFMLHVLHRLGRVVLLLVAHLAPHHYLRLSIGQYNGQFVVDLSGTKKFHNFIIFLVVKQPAPNSINQINHPCPQFNT